LGRKMMVAIYQILKSQRTSLQASSFKWPLQDPRNDHSRFKSALASFPPSILNPDFQMFGAVGLMSLATPSVRVISSSTALLAPTAAHTSDNDGDDNNWCHGSTTTVAPLAPGRELHSLHSPLVLPHIKPVVC
jgi:hypothetical protein